MVPLRAVRRREHAPTGRRDAPELPHRLRRVVAVLEHLRAEDEIELAVADGEALHPADQIGALAFVDVDADVLLARSAKKG